MDEARFQEYMELLEALQHCADGNEQAILQQHPDLLERELVLIAVSIAQQFNQQGQQQGARRLENVAMHLALELGMLDKEVAPDFTSLLAVVDVLRAEVILNEVSNIQDLQYMPLRVEFCQKALALISRQSNEYLWATLQFELGNSWQQNPLGNRAENIEAAIRAYKLSLKVMTQDTAPIEWSVLMNNLATSYTERICGERAENIEKAIQAYERSLTVRTRDAMPREWAMSMDKLASAYAERVYGERAENIEIAIRSYEDALAVITPAAMPVEWAASINNLANAYYFRVRGDRAENIEEAIRIYHQSLEVTTRDSMPVDWAISMSNLAAAYCDRVDGDRAENIETAIRVFQQSLEVTTRDAMPVDWAQSMVNLANAYNWRIRGNRAENIEEAIRIYKQSLEVMTQETMPRLWAAAMQNLANLYKDRIRGDRAENIETAILTFQQSLTVRTQESMPVQWAMSLDNLAGAYLKRIYGDREKNIEFALDAYKQSLEVRTREAMPIQWASSMNNLAIAYYQRIRGEREENIECALDAYKQSLEVNTRESMPIRWAMAMNNLAGAYKKRIRGEREENIEFALDAYKQSLEVRKREAMPFDWATSTVHLAEAYTQRINGDRSENIEAAIRAYSDALEVLTPDIHPNYCLHAARQVADLYADSSRCSKAQPKYHTALIAAEILYQAALSKNSQEAELSKTVHLNRRAAYAYAKTGDLKAAATTLERGRARSLSETLQRDRADLEAIRQINPELVDRYQSAANTIRQAESTERHTNIESHPSQFRAENFSEQVVQARQTLQDCLADIRQIPGFESFLELPAFSDIEASIKPNHPLVYLLHTPNGGLALIVTNDGVTELWLDDLTDDYLLDLVNNVWFQGYKQFQSNRQVWFDALDHVTQKLWEPLLAPLIEYLQQHQFVQATLIPTGSLSFLPLHAAWTPDHSQPTGRRYALDTIQFTYAPNALSLNAARGIARNTPPHTLLTINEPQPVNASPLPSAGIEVAKAISTFPGKGNWKILQHEAATRAAVLDVLPQYTVAHFSCHASANLSNPLESGLAMAHDEILSLRELLDLNLQGLRLAILSACETGIPGTSLPDEVISLSTGLIQAGAAGVVSSLWSVADLSTMLLISRFYDLWRIEHFDPATALRKAQIWLRDSSNSEFVPYLKRSHPDLANQLQKLSNNPFFHPFYWAAFTYIGV